MGGVSSPASADAPTLRCDSVAVDVELSPARRGRPAHEPLFVQSEEAIAAVDGHQLEAFGELAEQLGLVRRQAIQLVAEEGVVVLLVVNDGDGPDFGVRA